MKKLTLKSFTLVVIFSLLKLNSQVLYNDAIVVSDCKIASQVGLDILKKGGNAIDASIATAFTLAVTLPSAGNIGGGGFIVFLNSDNESKTIDFREKAPINSTKEMFLDESGNLIRGINHNSVLSIGVPGTVAGLFFAHKKYGKLSWKKLIQPAIDIANNGFIMTKGLYNSAKNVISKKQTFFLKNYFNNDQNEIVKPGEVWHQKKLAKTLEAIRDSGKDGFYDGWVAKKIISFMEQNDGLISHEDLKKYRAIERDPVIGDYRGNKVYSIGPPSSGGVTLVSMLNVLENIDLKQINFNSSQHIHFLAEIMKSSYKDRAKFLGDPDFNKNMPIDSLLSKKYAKNKFLNINSKRASKSILDNHFEIYEGNNTTHISVIDENKNAVSLTTTLEDSYGVGMGSNELGFLFNNEMGDFNPVANLTNENGLIGTLPNLIEPEKRMLSSMTPTIIAKNNLPYIIIGSPGGRTIINTVFQTISNIIDYKMSLKDAIESSKIHHQWFPDEIKYEKSKIPIKVLNELKLLGHNLIEVESLGNLMGIKFDEKSLKYNGYSDSASADGEAKGY
jgi:gamma-glutamyltranspeptidase/glutathione hydrolase